MDPAEDEDEEEPEAAEDDVVELLPEVAPACPQAVKETSMNPSNRALKKRRISKTPFIVNTLHHVL